MFVWFSGAVLEALSEQLSYGVLTEHSEDGGAGSAVGLGQLSETQALLPAAEDSGRVQGERLAADVPAFKPGPAHPGPDPLDDEVSLEFSDRTDDDHHSPAQRTSGIDLLAEADELDVEPD